MSNLPYEGVLPAVATELPLATHSLLVSDILYTPEYSVYEGQGEIILLGSTSSEW